MLEEEKRIDSVVNGNCGRNISYNKITSWQTIILKVLNEHPILRNVNTG